MVLDLDGDGPLYLQLTRALEVALRADRFGAGARLPATREFAEQLGLSRNTVRRAYEQLRLDGAIVGRHGSGTYSATLTRKTAKPRPLAPARAYSEFARRSRDLEDFRMARLHHDLRFNLQYGEPITDVLLTDVWRRELSNAAVRTSLGYPDSQGLPALREAICRHLQRRRGLSVAPADVLVVTGAQQAYALAARVLLDARDRVVLENPCYFFARHVFHAHGARIQGIDVDRFGLITARLPARRPGLVCVTPAHQFPLGFVLANNRRVDLLAYASRLDTWILEDDYDADFRFDARPTNPLRATDPDDRVIYVGTFSKVLAPSLRLAYVVMPRALRRDFVAAKRLSDLGCPAVEQAALASFIDSGGFERHLRRVAKTLRERRAALTAGIAQHAPLLRLSDTGAGMHMVAWLDRLPGLTEPAIIAAARRLGLGLYPISSHYLREPRPGGLLLGFAGMAPTELDAACQLLGRTLREMQIG